MSQDIKFEKFMREGKAIENAVMEILKKDFAEYKQDPWTVGFEDFLAFKYY